VLGFTHCARWRSLPANSVTAGESLYRELEQSIFFRLPTPCFSPHRHLRRHRLRARPRFIPRSIRRANCCSAGSDATTSSIQLLVHSGFDTSAAAPRNATGEAPAVSSPQIRCRSACSTFG